MAWAHVSRSWLFRPGESNNEWWFLLSAWLIAGLDSISKGSLIMAWQWFQTVIFHIPLFKWSKKEVKLCCSSVHIASASRHRFRLQQARNFPRTPAPARGWTWRETTRCCCQRSPTFDSLLIFPLVPPLFPELSKFDLFRRTSPGTWGFASLHIPHTSEASKARVPRPPPQVSDPRPLRHVANCTSSTCHFNILPPQVSNLISFFDEPQLDFRYRCGNSGPSLPHVHFFTTKWLWNPHQTPHQTCPMPLETWRHLAARPLPFITRDRTGGLQFGATNAGQDGQALLTLASIIIPFFAGS